MPSSIRSSKRSTFYLDSSGEKPLQEFEKGRYFNSGQDFFAFDLKIHPEYYTGQYNIIPNFDINDGIFIVGGNFEFSITGLEDRYVWLDPKYDNIVNQTGLFFQINKNMLGNSSGYFVDPSKFIDEKFALIQNEGLTASSTQTTKDTSFFPTADNSTDTFLISVKVDQNSSGSIVEFGAGGDGLILYAYDGYIRLTAGDGSKYDNSSNSIELSGELPNTFSEIDVLFSMDREGNLSKLFFDNVLIDSGNFTNDRIFGNNDGSINDPIDPPANRGSFGNSDGIESISSGEIIMPFYLYQDDYISSNDVSSQGSLISQIQFLEDFSNIQNSGEQTGITFSTQEFGNLPVDPYLGSGEYINLKGTRMGVYKASMLNSGQLGMNDIFGTRFYELYDNIFLANFSGLFGSGLISYKNTGEYDTGTFYSSGFLDLVYEENFRKISLGLGSYPIASYTFSGDNETGFISGSGMVLTPETGFQESGMPPNEGVLYDPEEYLLSEYSGSGLIYNDFPSVRSNFEDEQDSFYWQDITPFTNDLPEIEKHGACYLNNYIYVFGGEQDGTVSNDTWRYDFSGDIWEKINLTIKPSGRKSFFSCAHSGKFYVFGGLDSSSGYLNDLWEFDPDTAASGEWTDLSPTGISPSARGSGNSMGAFGSNIYLFGGSSGSHNFGDTWEFDLTGNAWNRILSEFLDFDGSDDYINYGNILDYERTDSFFIEATISSTSTDHQSIVSKMDSSSPHKGYDLILNSSGQFQFYIINTVTSNAINVRTTDSYNDGEVYTVKVEYDGSSNANGVNFYVNGSLVSSVVVDNTLSSNITNSFPFVIGTREGNSLRFDGLIYDVNVNDELIVDGRGNQTSNWTDNTNNISPVSINGSPSTTTIDSSPSARRSCVGTSTDNEFYVFGGYTSSYQNDLWKYGQIKLGGKKLKIKEGNIFRVYSVKYTTNTGVITENFGSSGDINSMSDLTAYGWDYFLTHINDSSYPTSPDYMQAFYSSGPEGYIEKIIGSNVSEIEVGYAAGTSSSTAYLMFDGKILDQTSTITEQTFVINEGVLGSGWQEISDAGPPSNRGDFVFEALNNRLYLHGGYDGSELSDFYEFNLDINRWRELNVYYDTSLLGVDPAPTGLSNHSSAVSDEKLFLIGSSEFSFQVIDFDGSNDYINYGNILDFERTDSFFIEFIFKTTDVNSNAVVSNRSSSGLERGYQVRVKSGKIQFQLVSDAGTNDYISIRTADTYNDGDFYKVRIEYNGSSDTSGVSFYIDNVKNTNLEILQNTLSNSTINTNNLQIGAKDSSNILFNGVIYDVNVNNELIVSGYGDQISDWTDNTNNISPDSINGSPSTTTISGFNNLYKANLENITGNFLPSGEKLIEGEVLIYPSGV